MRILLMLFFACMCFGENIDNIIADISNNSGVSKDIYATIIDIESGGINNIIAFNGSKNFYKWIKGLSDIVSDITIKYIGDRIVITADSKDTIKAIAKELYLAKQNFDLGIAQINSNNFEFHEIPQMLDTKYNLIKANNILADCYERYNLSIKSTIECYNKGYRNHAGYSYWNKFIKSYLGEAK